MKFGKYVYLVFKSNFGRPCAELSSYIVLSSYFYINFQLSCYMLWCDRYIGYVTDFKKAIKMSDYILRCDRFVRENPMSVFKST